MMIIDMTAQLWPLLASAIALVFVAAAAIGVTAWRSDRHPAQQIRRPDRTLTLIRRPDSMPATHRPPPVRQTA